MFSSNRVVASEEFHRVKGLPRRSWTVEEGEALAGPLTQLLKTPNGTMTFRPVQAIALKEAWEVGGLFCSISVSGGKTLLSMCLSRVWNAERPALLAPAKLHRLKTKKEMLELSKHWSFKAPELINYEAIGVVTGKDVLDRYEPDVLILDELHKVRNPQASRTRRIKRYLAEHPECKVAAMSGSTIKRSIKDYAHVLRWCLGVHSPLPIRRETLEEWALALDEKIAEFARADPGALLTLDDQIEDTDSPLAAARRKVARRLFDTPGVIRMTSAGLIDATIEIRELQVPKSDKIEDAFEKLRNELELPDGQELVEACEIYRHARELALGFYYKWRVPAPTEWRNKRKAWFGWVRSKLSGSRTYDSPDELAKAFPNQPEWLDWKAIRNSYKPDTILVWIDTAILNECLSWIRSNAGIVFVEHSHFGTALANLAQVPYFAGGGEDALGRSIEDFEGRVCVASIAANGEGRNLHRRRNGSGRLVGFDKMLVVSPPPNNPAWEQLLGRLHRQGMLSDRVSVEVIINAKEQGSAFWQSVRDAENCARDLNDEAPKLLDAEISVRTEDEWPEFSYAFDTKKDKKELHLPWK